MSTVPAIFDLFEGPAKVGRAIGKPTEHATAMKRRESIPVCYWPALIAYAAEHKIAGVDYPSLIAAHAASRVKRQSRRSPSEQTGAAA